jgi:hypothetical protein
MKICEVLGQDSEDIIEVKNIIMFLKSKGIKEIPVNAVVRELSKRGYDFTKEEIEPIISNMNIVGAVENGNIKLNGMEDDAADIQDDDIPERDDDFDMDEERVKQMARSSRLRRDR